MVAGITAACFHLHLEAFVAGFIYLLPILLIAFYWGFWEATLASILAVGCLDYFFTTPLFTLYMSDWQDWIALPGFEAVAITVSRLAMQLRHQAAETEKQRSRFEQLYRVSKEALRLNRQQACGSQLVELIREIFAVDGVLLFDASEARYDSAGAIPLSNAEIHAIYARGENEDDSVRRVSSRILHVGARPVGALCIAAGDTDPSTIDAIASISSIALERAHSFLAESSAEAARQSEQLRSTVLDALAHAFKTPLATILSASSGMLEIGGLSERQEQLVILIDEETQHLSDLSGRLLRTAKLDREDLKVRLEKLQLADLMQKSHEYFARELYGREVRFHNQATRDYAWGDPQLVRMALTQLLDNAAKYADSASPISLSLRENESEIVLSVHNEGSFIPPEEQQRIFQRFYRSPGSEHKASGTGIGLSVTRRIAQAHRGRVWVESDPRSGTTFFFTLPHITKEN